MLGHVLCLFFLFPGVCALPEAFFDVTLTFRPSLGFEAGKLPGTTEIHLLERDYSFNRDDHLRDAYPTFNKDSDTVVRLLGSADGDQILSGSYDPFVIILARLGAESGNCWSLELPKCLGGRCVSRVEIGDVDRLTKIDCPEWILLGQIGIHI